MKIKFNDKCYDKYVGKTGVDFAEETLQDTPSFVMLEDITRFELLLH